jgi:mono/diheme cytochrome c family protein
MPETPCRQTKLSASRARSPILLLAAAAAMIALSGCDLQENADKTTGRALFVQKCGTCHALKEAGTQAQVGPDLDDAFAQARAQGMDQDTFEGIVKAQIENPRTASPKQTDIYMPPHLVEGEDAKDVAAYVASVAGVPGIKPPSVAGGPGAQVFAAQGCGSCHTLGAANTTGTTGPDLDKVLPGMSAAEISQSITDPNAKPSPGYPPNVMPQTFKSLPKDQLSQLVAFLIKSTSGGKKK